MLIHYIIVFLCHEDYSIYPIVTIVMTAFIFYIVLFTRAQPYHTSYDLVVALVEAAAKYDVNGFTPEMEDVAVL